VKFWLVVLLLFWQLSIIGGVLMTIQTAMNFLIPLAVFIEIVILGLALRFYFKKLLEKTQQSNKWIHASLFIESLWHPFIFWFVFLAAYVWHPNVNIASNRQKIIRSVIRQYFYYFSDSSCHQPKRKNSSDSI